MFEDNALHVDGTAISLDDALHEHCFVSHAHSDHTAAFGKRRKIMASDETFIIMGKEPESLSFPSVKLTPAGHMLGARQLIAEADGEKFVCLAGNFSALIIISGFVVIKAAAVGDENDDVFGRLIEMMPEGLTMAIEERGLFLGRTLIAGNAEDKKRQK